jgi:hypothetical protein
LKLFFLNCFDCRDCIDKGLGNTFSLSSLTSRGDQIDDCLSLLLSYDSDIVESFGGENEGSFLIDVVETKKD